MCCCSSGVEHSFYAAYHVGSAMGWSDIYFFTTFPDGTSWSPRIVIFGDMGNENAQSLSRLQEETQRGFYDAVFHVGEKKFVIFCAADRVE